MSLESFSKELDQTYQRLRSKWTPVTRGYDWRVTQLKALRKMLAENEPAFNQAMMQDLHKPPFECSATEQGVVIGEIDFTLKHLAGWMKPERVPTPLVDQPGSCEIHHDPLGLALIIGAWNYPVQLLLAPFIGAIAGGNSAILKPSEISEKTGRLIGELLPKYMDTESFAVIQGGAAETDLLLNKVFDTIFFTGSGPVGKIVMAKAAPHLTPITLELGGKSPAIIFADADLKVAAHRIAWGKFMNAGQTCVAPDYVLIQPQVKMRFIEELKIALQEFYGTDPQKSPDFCRIVNLKNFDRLKNLMTSQKIVHGGKTDRDDKYIAPTLVDMPAPDSPLMQEEIFGPILPLLEIAGLEDAIRFVNSRAKPLALYLFSKDQDLETQILKRTSAGGVCINDVVMHLPVPHMPFGGVGASGMGHYHGHFSFKTFTHAKGVLKKATWLDVPLRYAPYTAEKMKWLRRLF